MKPFTVLSILLAPTIGVLMVRPMVADAQFWAAYHEQERPEPLVELAALVLFPAPAQTTSPRQAWKPITFSVYSDYYDGRRAADGSRFDQAKYTCASNSHKLGTKLDLRVGRVTLRNVPVTDRMAKRFTGVRIDLSRAAWDDLSERRAPGLMKGEWSVSK